MSVGKLADRIVVTFDCWATLIVEQDWPVAHGVRVEALCDVARESHQEVGRREAGRVFDAAWGRHMELWREGVATGARDVAAWALTDLGINRPDSLAQLVERFEEASHSGRVVALPGACETLSRLRASGRRRALVCDTRLTPGRVVRKHLDRLGLLRLLESLAFSDEVGSPKPGPRIFQAALEPFGVEPGRAVHVGDLRANDVAGARRLGMCSVRMRAHYDDCSDLPDADHVVDSHAELVELLGF